VLSEHRAIALLAVVWSGGGASCDTVLHDTTGVTTEWYVAPVGMRHAQISIVSQ
jgi:hypothetical protein